MVKCIYCGNNPTSHFLSRISDNYSIASRPANKIVSALGLTRFAFAAADYLFEGFIFLWILAGAAKWKSGEIITIPRAKVLWDEAWARGIKMETLVIFGKPVDLYRAFIPEKVGAVRSAVGLKTKKIIFSGLPRPIKLSGDS